MQKLIGYSRVSTRQQSTDRQEADILAAGVRRDDLYVDHGVSGARASRPEFDRALSALIEGDTLVITTLDRLGRSTQNMLGLADELRARGAGLRVLNLGGGDVDTSTPMGAMVFTIMAALAQMEHEIKRERVLDSISKRRAAGKSLGGRPQVITDSQIRNAIRLADSGEPVAEVARDLGMSRATYYRRAKTCSRHSGVTEAPAPQRSIGPEIDRSEEKCNARRHLSVILPDALKSLASGDNLVTWPADAGMSSVKPPKRGESRCSNTLNGNAEMRKAEPKSTADSPADGGTHDPVSNG